ncbi:HlyC/CorC family transporter [Pontibacter qinzhouensis]|uniref:HlyC/CorC family transporter n=1 Tax=Pontibacter qinzhouensis TaxID=2603253 RepID=A0A5C8IIH7_9BACT|nr:hemolysin family protein [Pontibacter qinzhouensis]TXK20971.1 HlyC/CorC family transporter [Pontibacter qinzhouensis]
MEIIILILLTMLNGFFALSELSIISVNKNRIAQKAKQGSRSANTVIKLLESPENFLSAIQVGITLIGIVSGAYGGAALSDDMKQWLSGFSFLAPYADTLSIILVVGLITYFSIVIGELIPKTIALGNADNIALTVAPIIKVFTVATMPLVKLLSGSTSFVIKLAGIKEPPEEKMSEEELRQIIKTAGKQGLLAKEEIQLHQNIFTYSEQRARNLRTHRMDVEYIDINQPVEGIKDIIQRSAHSKFPVADGTFDKIIGVLTAKRFYEYLAGNREESLSSVLQQPIYIPETMLANAVLNIFKKQKQYLGIVIDEYGSIEGIITLHDILEAIVGDLPDMDEVDEPSFVKRDDGSLLVDGSVEIYDLNRELKEEVIPKDADNYVTLAGFISYTLGKFPAAGDKFQVGGYELEIVDMDGFRVDKVILKRAINSKIS